ncbi:helix-turn-helix domain-containing protein [Streptomyces sp. NPDC002402]
MAGTESEETGGGTGASAEEQDWDEGMSEVLEMVGRHVRRWRERAGLTQAELGSRIGYTEHQVSAVERGRRIPKPVFLDRADEAVGAEGMLAEFREDVAKVQYPKKVRDLARLESEAVELGAYAGSVIHGLLQTKAYAQVLYRMHRPTLDEDVIERNVAARMARQEIFKRRPAPYLSFVQEEATLRRPIGGRVVMRDQLQQLLDIGKLRNVEIQVMPTLLEDHAGLPGSFLLLDPKNGHKAAHSEAAFSSQVTADRNKVRMLEGRYGIIRAQALTPRESLTFIEKVLGET